MVDEKGTDQLFLAVLRVCISGAVRCDTMAVGGAACACLPQP